MTAPATTRRISVEQILAVASAVLLPLGIGLIILGWYGAAHTPYLFEQLPYLISGGLLGVGLAVVGAVIYFGSWMARGSAEQQRRGEEIAGLLREVRDELRNNAPQSVPTTRRAKVASNGKAPFVATAKGAMLHRPDCAAVVGREDLRAVSVEGDGLAPCSLCDPLATDLLAH